MQYTLSDHVYACRSNGHVVFLDLHRELYMGLDFQYAPGIASAVTGFDSEVGECGAMSQSMDAIGEKEVGRALEELLNNGMLTPVQNWTGGRRGLSKAIAPAEEALFDGYEDVRAKVGIGDVVRYVRATVTVKFLMKTQTLYNLVERMRRRRKDLRAADVSTLRYQAGIFDQIRPFFHGAYNECLFHSLALSEFLANLGHATEFLIGVSNDPFEAHSWLQSGRVVLNDVPEYVRLFTPILAV